MIENPMLTMKTQVLSRRVNALQVDFESWIDNIATNQLLEKNFSQVEALNRFINILFVFNKNSIDAINSVTEMPNLLNNTLELTQNVIRTHFLWDFFRSRLELRLTSQFQKQLLVADLIAYDCYTTIINRAKTLRIVPQNGFREYPLVGLIPGFSPATWPRGRRPKALQNPKLPVPIIDIPLDHIVNPWELLTIAHEVGHDIDEDLGGLTKSLTPDLVKQLEAAHTPISLIDCWKAWLGEILADIVGILLTGSDFVTVLAGLLTLPQDYMMYYKSTDPHPPHYLRVFINTILLRHLGLSKEADSIDRNWKALYGDIDGEFKTYFGQIEVVISTILHMPIEVLRDVNGNKHCLKDLISFPPDFHDKIQKAANELIRGEIPKSSPIRYIASASLRAFESSVSDKNFSNIERLALQTQSSIIELSPPGKLPASRHNKHIENLAQAYFHSPLEDIGLILPFEKSYND